MNTLFGMGGRGGTGGSRGNATRKTTVAKPKKSARNIQIAFKPSRKVKGVGFASAKTVRGPKRTTSARGSKRTTAKRGSKR